MHFILKYILRYNIKLSYNLESFKLGKRFSHIKVVHDYDNMRIFVNKMIYKYNA